MEGTMYKTWKAGVVNEVIATLRRQTAYGHTAVDVLKESLRYAYEEAYGEVPNDSDIFPVSSASLHANSGLPAASAAAEATSPHGATPPTVPQ